MNLKEIYRGFVRSSGKRPLERLKKDNLSSLEDVEHDDYGGVLNDDIVLIDVDDVENSDKLLDIIEQEELNTLVRYTEHGAHFIFKNTIENKRNGNKYWLPIGIQADVKFGYNTTFEPIKINGVERQVAYDTDNLDVIPNWLFPLDRQTRFDFKQLQDGNRNNGLFEYILPLQSEGRTEQEIKEIIYKINNYMFDEPLPDNEIKTITRKSAFSEDVFFIKNKLNVERFAKFLISEHNIKRVEGQLSCYQNGIYLSGIAHMKKLMIKSLPQLKDKDLTEVYKRIQLLLLDSEDYEVDVEYIGFKNGLYDLEHDRLVDFTPNIIITNIIPWNYNPAAKSDLVDHTLLRLANGDEQIKKIMLEMFGYTLFDRNELGKMFFLTGTGSNGKSTFLAMIKNALGFQNTSSLSLEELNDRFKKAILSGKLANIGDDISDEYIKDTSVLKKLVTGESIIAENKGETPFELRNRSKLLFSANSIPRLGKGKDSYALSRRMVIIPFTARFSRDDEDYDPYIISKLTGELDKVTRQYLHPERVEYLLQLGLKHLKDVLANKGFSSSAVVEEELKEYKYDNNPILEFFDELNEDDFLRKTNKEVYKVYTEYCYVNNFIPVAQRQFSRQLCNHFDLTSVTRRVDGTLYRIFEYK